MDTESVLVGAATPSTGQGEGNRVEPDGDGLMGPTASGIRTMTKSGCAGYGPHVPQPAIIPAPAEPSRGRLHQDH